jgi:hypothetical protein
VETIQSAVRGARARRAGEAGCHRSGRSTGPREAAPTLGRGQGTLTRCGPQRRTFKTGDSPAAGPGCREGLEAGGRERSVRAHPRTRPAAGARLSSEAGKAGSLPDRLTVRPSASTLCRVSQVSVAYLVAEGLAHRSEVSRQPPKRTRSSHSEACREPRRRRRKMTTATCPSSPSEVNGMGAGPVAGSRLKRGQCSGLQPSRSRRVTGDAEPRGGTATRYTTWSWGWEREAKVDPLIGASR